MNQIIIYTDKNGRSPISDYLNMLAKKKDKSSRIKYDKITQYIQVLQEKGIQTNGERMKHIGEDIWELRPLQDRILFAYIVGNRFLLLHRFVKKTQKTPKKEIEQAKGNLRDWKERNETNEKK